MHQHPVLILALLQRRTVNDHGVLHALDQSFYRGDLRPGILAQRVGEMFEREPHHRVRFFPRLRVRVIERLDENPVPAAGIPPQVRTGSPRKVADLARSESPRSCARHSVRAIGDRLRPRDDRHDFTRAQRARQPGALLRRANGGGIGQRTRRRHHKPGRHGQTHIEVAILEVELSRAEKGERIPAVYVVVDGHARIPLAQLVELRSDPPHPTAAVGRNRKMPGDVERDAEIGSERAR